MTNLINVVGKVNSGAATKRVCRALADEYGADGGEGEGK